MCGRYNIHDDPFMRAMLAQFRVPELLRTQLNIAPTEPVPVVFEEEGERHMRAMRWWLVPSWVPEISTRFSMFNAKAETLVSSKAFRGPLRHHRCILPASSFIEWTLAAGGRQPWLIRPVDSAIAFAGLFDVWEKDGNCLESCTIITTAAAPGIDRLHPRMPLMLRPEEFDAWLDVSDGRGPPPDMLRPRLPAEVELASLSPTVNNPRHKNASSQELLGPAERITLEH